MARYDKMTQVEFDVILEELVMEMAASEILQVDGVYSALAEYLNNDVLDRWAEWQEQQKEESNG
jgi:hypothetical protein